MQTHKCPTNIFFLHELDASLHRLAEVAEKHNTQSLVLEAITIAK
jgi:hypothetical protein